MAEEPRRPGLRIQTPTTSEEAAEVGPDDAAEPLHAPPIGGVVPPAPDAQIASARLLARERDTRENASRAAPTGAARGATAVGRDSDVERLVVTDDEIVAVVGADFQLPAAEHPDLWSWKSVASHPIMLRMMVAAVLAFIVLEVWAFSSTLGALAEAVTAGIPRLAGVCVLSVGVALGLLQIGTRRVRSMEELVIGVGLAGLVCVCGLSVVGGVMPAFAWVVAMASLAALAVLAPPAFHGNRIMRAWLLGLASWWRFTFGLALTAVMTLALGLLSPAVVMAWDRSSWESSLPDSKGVCTARGMIEGPLGALHVAFGNRMVEKFGERLAACLAPVILNEESLPFDMHQEFINKGLTEQQPAVQAAHAEKVQLISQTWRSAFVGFPTDVRAGFDALLAKQLAVVGRDGDAPCTSPFVVGQAQLVVAALGTTNELGARCAKLIADDASGDNRSRVLGAWAPLVTPGFAEVSGDLKAPIGAALGPGAGWFHELSAGGVDLYEALVLGSQPPSIGRWDGPLRWRASVRLVKPEEYVGKELVKYQVGPELYLTLYGVPNDYSQVRDEIVSAWGLSSPVAMDLSFLQATQADVYELGWSPAGRRIYALVRSDGVQGAGLEGDPWVLLRVVFTADRPPGNLSPLTKRRSGRRR